MSESYGQTVPTDTTSRDGTSSLETATHEASDLKDTAVSEAGHVAETAKGEAKAVAQEVSYQAKDLFAQTQRELKDQAHVQQQRVASGLRSMSDELDSMVSSAQNPGMAADILRQASSRMAGAATWLGDRDPGAVLYEVKAFARRRPGAFILGAAVLGIAAGRLTRALAANASSDTTPESGAALTSGPTYTNGTRSIGYEPPITPPAVEETPVYAQSSAGRATHTQEDVGDVRSDSF